MAVFLTCAAPRGHALIDRELYLPRSWTTDPARRQAAGIAEGTVFATKPAAAVPDLLFVLDHCGKPDITGGALEPWASAVRGLAARPNTACKLSGLVTEAPPGAPAAAFAPFADVILAAFGARRVMFGSDWPICLLASSYSGVLALARTLVSGLSEAERAAVFSDTARQAYRLHRPGTKCSAT